MKNKTIYVALSEFCKNDERPRQLLTDAGFEIRENVTGRRLQREEMPETLRGAIGVLAGVEPYDAPLFFSLPDLRCISRCGVGTDNIDLEAAQKRGIEIRNTPDTVIQPVAEMTVAMIFDLLRKLTWHASLLKKRQWKKESGVLLAGKRVGIIGVGRIGRKVAEILTKLEADVVGTDPFPDLTWAEKSGIHFLSLEDLLKTSDIVSLHLSTLPQRAFQFGGGEFDKMKKGALFVNVSRGGFVDENALYTALKTGRLGGAALDVFENEPYSGPLCDLENVILTPHIATLTVESRAAMEWEAAQNLLKSLGTL